MKEKQILVPKSFFVDVYRLIILLENFEGIEDLQPIIQDIQRVIDDKCDAMERRRAFEEYKTASQGSVERETARQAYLNKSHIHKDWKTKKETPLC